MLLRFSFLFALLLITTATIAQDTVPERALNEVLISGTSKHTLSTIHLDQRKIQNKLAPDMGAILVLLPGLQIRNYGDVGGLKTAGFRSLGAAHSSIVIDGQLQPATQTGSIDLSAIPSEFVKSVDLVRQDGNNVLLPIQSKLAGSLIQLSTIHQATPTDSTRLRIGLQGGSFGYYSADLNSTIGYKNLRLTLSGRGRTYEGNFPFEYQNGYQTIASTRKNNSSKDITGTGGLTWFLNRFHTLSAKYTYTEAKKELAGAVVFYNETANQHLFTTDHNATLRHQYITRYFSVATQFTAQSSALTYLDSNYLNQQGYLKQQFTTHYLNGQSQVTKQFTRKLRLALGTEVSRETIVAGTLNATPNRYTINLFSALQWNWQNQNLDLQFGAQRLQDQRTSTTSEHWYFMPGIQYQLALGKYVSLGAIARYTVRQPTFSELYYQQVGNTNLLPEEAIISSIPVRVSWKKGKWHNALRLEPFYTYNTNKIVAVPTKNLFVWSIQNIGISQSTGLECYNESRLQWNKSSFGQTVNFTYQSAVDLTDRNSVLYGSQLTYIPVVSGTLELDYAFKHWSVYALYSAQGMRYALQQNIPTNEVEAYYTIDIGGTYSVSLQQQRLSISASVKNLTNQYNQYIRYFVLPGINYQLKLTYEI